MSPSATILIFELVVLIFSVIIHEISHGYIAEWLGDPTARLAGRLTLNPISHFSLFGMVVLPLITYFAWGIPVGGANPVPYNPYHLKDPERGGALIALAGPASNLMVAAVFGVLVRTRMLVMLAPPMLVLFGWIVFINIFLAIFNLVPVPPLDGSKVIHLFLPWRWGAAWDAFWDKAWSLFRTDNVIGLFVVLLLVFYFFPYVLAAVFAVIQPIIGAIYVVFTGQSATF